MNSLAERQLHEVQTVSEALVVVDLVDSTKTTTRHGWHAVGKYVIRDLRTCINYIREQHGLQCRKFTGDGYLLAFRHNGDAAYAVIHAIQAIVAITRAIEAINERQTAHERRIRLRFALHYGEVDAIEGDREGPEVSFTFRIEGIDAKAFDQALTPSRILPGDFPLYDYALVSQTVINILQAKHVLPCWEFVSVFPLKGFQDYYALYLIRNLSQLSLARTP